VRSTGELVEHADGVVRICRLSIDAAVEVDGRVHAERDPSVGVDGTGLPLRVASDELDGIGVGRVVLDVLRGDDLERDLQLLEDRAALRRRRSERQEGLRATQISSIGQLCAHSGS
jgi:hypothetical protein